MNDQVYKNVGDKRLRNFEPVLNMMLECQTHAATRLLERFFEPLNDALWTVLVLFPRVGNKEHKPKERALEAIDWLKAEYGEIRALLTEEAAKLTQELQDAGVEEQAQVLRPRTYEVTVKTPEAGQYLQLVRQLDDLCKLRQLAWLAGLLETQAQHGGLEDGDRRLIKRLARPSNKLRELARECMNLLRHQQEARAAMTPEEREESDARNGRSLSVDDTGLASEEDEASEAAQQEATEIAASPAVVPLARVAAQQ